MKQGLCVLLCMGFVWTWGCKSQKDAELAQAPQKMAKEEMRRMPAKRVKRRPMPSKQLAAPSAIANNVASTGAPAPAPMADKGSAPAPVELKRQARKDAEKESQEQYRDYGVNPFVQTSKDALSTFAVDVDTAAYAIVRRKLNSGTLPPVQAVRVEELVNYFAYDYPAPKGNKPFSVALEGLRSPFNPEHHFLRVGLQGKLPSKKERKKAHLTFLVDTSGSMHSDDKMGLLKRSLRILVQNLQQGDTVALATYAGSVRKILDPTGMQERKKIENAIEQLSARGSTAMSSGIELAYSLAMQNFVPNAVNRVIVCSDGDANVGPKSHKEILALIKSKKEEGVTLSTIGFGMGNYQDEMMEQLANKGNGNYYYIDTLSEAKKVFQEQLAGTLEVIAKDVKIQVEFNPKSVKQYRLLGYENRDVRDQDFRNDKVDAGEIGAGHRVTAIYELKLNKKTGPLGTVRIRHKQPQATKASEQAFPIAKSVLKKSWQKTSADTQLAVGVAAYAELLRKSPYAKQWSMGTLQELLLPFAKSKDATKQEFVGLVKKAAELLSPTKK